jgi:MFS family permease
MLHCLRTFFTVYLVSDVGFGLAAAGLAFSASQAAGIVGQIWWAAISDRALGAHATLAVIGVVTSVAAALTAFVGPGWPAGAVVAVAVLFGLGAAGFFPVLLGEIARCAPPGQAGALTSGSQVFILPAVFAGPLLFGAVASGAGYPCAFAALAAITLAASAIVAISARPIPAVPAAESAASNPPPPRP